MLTCDLFAVANLLVTATTLTSLFNIHCSLIIYFLLKDQCDEQKKLIRSMKWDMCDMLMH